MHEDCLCCCSTVPCEGQGDWREAEERRHGILRRTQRRLAAMLGDSGGRTRADTQATQQARAVPNQRMEVRERRISRARRDAVVGGMSRLDGEIAALGRRIAEIEGVMQIDYQDLDECSESSSDC